MALADGHVFFLTNMKIEEDDELPLWRLYNLLKIPEGTITRWVKEGKFPKAVKIKVGYTDEETGKIKYKKPIKRWIGKDILDWLKQQQMDKEELKATKYYDF